MHRQGFRTRADAVYSGLFIAMQPVASAQSEAMGARAPVIPLSGSDLQAGYGRRLDFDGAWPVKLRLLGK